MTARWGAAISLVSAALLAPLLIVAPTHQAKASCDVLACGRLSADLFTGAAAAAWQILKSPECSSDLDDNIAVAAALLAIEELPKSPINTANCVGSLKAITDLVGKNAGNPAIKAALSFLTDNSAAQQYLDCACPLAAAGVETINKIVADADACSSFSPSDCIGSLYGVFDKPQLSSPGGYCNYTIQCGPGTLSNCMTAHNWAQAYGNCVDNSGQGVVCQPGLDVEGPPTVYTCSPSGPTQSCTGTNLQYCTCPVGQGWQGDHCGVCPVTKTTKDSLSADGLTMTRETCTDTKTPSDDRLSCSGGESKTCTGEQFKCPAGQKIASWGQCARACGAGQVYDSTGQCNTCPANFKTAFDSPDTSKGTCQECAADERSLEGSDKCTELTCAPHGYQDPNKPHACILCPGNQFYSPNSRGGGQGPKSKQAAGTCGCGDTQVLEGDTCLCAKGANVHPGLSAELSCTCPAGSKMNYKTGACVCGLGKHIEIAGGGTANTCVADGNTGKIYNPPVMPPTIELQKTPPAKTVIPFKCPPGSHPNPNRAKSCVPNRPGAEFRPAGPPVFIPPPGGGHITPGGIRR